MSKGDQPVEVEKTGDIESEDNEKNGEFKWYIAKTMTGQENKVTRALKERIVNYKLAEFFSS